jgi:hypothetical protein
LFTGLIFSFKGFLENENNSKTTFSTNKFKVYTTSPFQDDTLNLKDKIQNLFGLNKSIDIVEFDDTLTLKFKKVTRNGKLSKWRKGKVWVEGDILSLFKNEALNPVNTKDTLFVNKPMYQSHKIDLDYYLDNFLDVNKYKSEQDWSAIQKITVKPYQDLKFKKINSQRFVYGFHPYWMGNAYYNYDFNIYNRIAYFGYVIDPKSGNDLSSATGINAHSWINSTLHEKANSFNCKVDLCIASFDVENNVAIFSTKKGADIRKQLVSNIVSLLKNKGDGVCFDIQKVPSSLKKNYIQLIKDVSLKLDKKKHQITVVLPRFDVGFPYNMTIEDFNQMSEFVDRWIITGDSFYGAKMENGELSESSIDNNWNIDQIDFEINRYPTELFDKLLLEIPLYSSRLMNNDVDTLLYIQPFRKIVQLYPGMLKPIENSFQQKLEYANLKNLKGVAIWASGYDHGTTLKNVLSTYAEKKDLKVDPKVSEMLADMISKNEETKDSLDLEDNFKANPELGALVLQKSQTMSFWDNFMPEKIEFHHVVIFCLIILLFFVVVGFIISLFYETAREFIFSTEYLINLGVLVGILSLIILLKHFNLIDAAGLVFALGIGVGIFAAWILFRKRIKKETEETP